MPPPTYTSSFAHEITPHVSTKNQPKSTPDIEAHPMWTDPRDGTDDFFELLPPPPPITVAQTEDDDDESTEDFDTTQLTDRVLDDSSL